MRRKRRPVRRRRRPVRRRRRPVRRKRRTGRRLRAVYARRRRRPVRRKRRTGRRTRRCTRGGGGGRAGVRGGRAGVRGGVRAAKVCDMEVEVAGRMWGRLATWLATWLPTSVQPRCNPPGWHFAPPPEGRAQSAPLIGRRLPTWLPTCPIKKSLQLAKKQMKVVQKIVARPGNLWVAEGSQAGIV